MSKRKFSINWLKWYARNYSMNFRERFPDSKTCGDRFWAESANNFWLQESNKLCTEFVLSDIVSKLLSEIWQSLLDMLCQQICGRNRAKSCIIWWQIESRLRIEFDSGRPCSVCHQFAGIACQQTLLTNPQLNVDTDSYGFVIKIWSSLLPIWHQIANILLSGLSRVWYERECISD